MKITEWFCRAVAAGLMHNDWSDVFAIKTKEDHYWRICDSTDNGCQEFGVDWGFIDNDTMPRDKNYLIQLRKDGKDLYSLEWRKPTEQDIGKMCWFYGGTEMVYAKLYEISMLHGMVYDYCATMDLDTPQYDYCLLADHGQIAPTEADFKQVYGE